MGLNHISIAAVIALLGGAPALHAETANQTDGAPAVAAGPAPSADPALDASPIAGAEPVIHPADVTEDPEPSGSPAPAETTEPSAPAESAAPSEPAGGTGGGDTLTMPDTPAAPPKKPASSTPIKVEVDNMPGRGASMAQVEKRFGQPREKLPPVGNPPITRWNYSDYTVYFEREYVIHSVRNTSLAEPAPVPQPSTDEAAPASGAQPAGEE